MPSPRASPALRPSSPLSHAAHKTAQFETLQPLTPRTMQSRPGTNSQAWRSANNASLRLPSLPRFHPANYPSAHGSSQTTPDGIASPQPPVSPRAHQRVYSDAQKHLLFYQRETVQAARAASPSRGDKPTSPRLVPLGSPGPVTPLELEGEEGYLVAGARGAGHETAAPDELVDRLIREEARRRTSRSPGRATSRER